MTQTNNYKGYSLFNDVEDRTLQTYNRFVTATNINNALNEKCVREYLKNFTDLEQRMISAMGSYIQVVGAETVAKQINTGDLAAFVEANKEQLH